MCATLATAPTRIECNDWEEPLYHPSRYKVLYGGRSSGKTWAVAKALVIQSHMERHTIYCVREHQKSLRLSAKPAIEGWIQRLGLGPWFHITNERIINTLTDSVFHFVGMSTVSEEDIKGWEGVTRCWVEEAHTMSHRSRNLIYPTIFRQPNSEFWATFNPKNRYDPIYMDFVVGQWGENSRYVRKVNYKDNPHFPDGEDEVRREWEKLDQLTYAHEWLGEPDDASSERKVLPYMLLETCVDSWELRPGRGVFGTGGFDVADTGADANALVNRFGPELFLVETWHGSQDFTVSDSARRAAETTVKNGITRLDYDAGGVDPVKGPIIDWKRNTGNHLTANPCRFNGKVQGEDVIFERARPRAIFNKQYFHNWGAQAGMVLRMRANNTMRLVKNESVDPGHCLFINPEMPQLTDFLRDMSQAEWKEDTGKLRVDKQPHGPGEQEPPSPDMFDAARLAFSYDANNGLRATSWV